MQFGFRYRAPSSGFSLPRRWHIRGWLAASAVPCVLAIGVALLSVCVRPELTHAQPGRQPRMGTGDWPELLELLRSYEFEAAAAILAQASPERLGLSKGRFHYLRGRVLGRLDRLDEAANDYAAAMTSPDDLPEAIVEELGFREALALALGGRCDKATPKLSELSEGRGRRASIVRAQLARCAHRLGDHATAEKALRAILDAGGRGVDDVRFRILLAESLNALGRNRAALAELRRVLVNEPAHPQISKAESLYESWGGKLRFSASERVTRARGFMEMLRFDETLAELDEVRPRNRKMRAEVLHLRGMSLFKMRNRYPEAAEVLGQAAALRSDTQGDDAFHAARATSRADDDRKAVRMYRQFALRFKGHRREPQALYLAAWLEIHHGWRAGVPNMRRFIRTYRKHPRAGSNVREATWHLALRAFERRAYREASELFASYAELDDGPLVRGRGLYWAARAFQARGAKKQAEEGYRKAIDYDGLHWYGLLARARLAEMGVTPPPPFDPGAEDTSGSAADEPLPTVAVADFPGLAAFYHELGLIEDARDEVRSAERSIRRARPGNEGLRYLSALYHAVGEYRRPYQLVDHHRIALHDGPSKSGRWWWDAAYPQAWPDVVHSAASDSGVPAAFLWAIMRQESGYNPSAISHAGARGLLQLMPETARRVAEGLGYEVNLAQLYDPAWNVPLAARHNRILIDRFEGRLPIAIAAFNAGSSRVERWLRDFGDTDLDHFVEKIPFNETRNYVRRVTTHLARYQYLLAHGAETQQHVLPLDLNMAKMARDSLGDD